jgi:hypothetical protein
MMQLKCFIKKEKKGRFNKKISVIVVKFGVILREKIDLL